MILMVRHEFNLGHAQGHVDACLSLYAEGLKGDGVIGAANQNICATAHADRGISGNTGVPAHQNSLVDRHVRWRQNRPCKNRIVRYAGIEPELFDHALIEFALILGRTRNVQSSSLVEPKIKLAPPLTLQVNSPTATASIAFAGETAAIAVTAPATIMALINVPVIAVFLRRLVPLVQAL